jgi:hypothetical protein
MRTIVVPLMEMRRDVVAPLWLALSLMRREETVTRVGRERRRC